MAKVVVNTLPPVPPTKSIVITLTEEEAGSLRHLFYAGVSIGVMSTMGLDSLYDELRSAAFYDHGSRMKFTGTVSGGN